MLPWCPSTACARSARLDLVLEVHIQPQRPLAVFTDVDEPLLEDPVLVVGHLMLVDDLGERRQHVLDDRAGSIDRGVGRDPFVLELVGGGVARTEGGGVLRGGHGRSS